MKTKYLIYIDCSNNMYVEDKYREIEIVHSEDDALNGHTQAEVYVSQLCNELFGKLINSIKPENLDIFWTRDIFIYELNGQLKFDDGSYFFLFTINMAEASEDKLRWFIDYSDEDDYKSAFIKLAKHGC